VPKSVRGPADRGHRPRRDAALQPCVSVLAAVTYWLRPSRCGPPGRCAITDGSSRCCRKRWASGLGDGRPMAGGPRSAAMQSPRRQPRGLYPELAGVCADVVTESASIASMPSDIWASTSTGRNAGPSMLLCRAECKCASSLQQMRGLFIWISPARGSSRHGVSRHRAPSSERSSHHAVKRDTELDTRMGRSQRGPRG